MQRMATCRAATHTQCISLSTSSAAAPRGAEPHARRARRAAALASEMRIPLLRARFVDAAGLHHRRSAGAPSLSSHWCLTQHCARTSLLLSVMASFVLPPAAAASQFARPAYPESKVGASLNHTTHPIKPQHLCRCAVAQPRLSVANTPMRTHPIIAPRLH